MPIWIWAVFAGILISAGMAIYTARQERRQENEFIEEEGRKYIERLHLEQGKRQVPKETEETEEIHGGEKNPA